MFYYFGKNDQIIPLFQGMEYEDLIDDGFGLYQRTDDGENIELSLDDLDESMFQKPVWAYIPSQDMIELIEKLLDLMSVSMTPAVSLLSLSPTKSEVQMKFEAFEELANNIIEEYKA